MAFIANTLACQYYDQAHRVLSIVVDFNHISASAVCLLFAAIGGIVTNIIGQHRKEWIITLNRTISC